MKRFIKNIIQRFSALFYQKLYPTWEKGFMDYARQKWAKEVLNQGEDVTLHDFPRVTVPHMLSVRSGTTIHKNVQLESDGGLVIADKVTIEEDVIIETINKQPAWETLPNPLNMKPVAIGKGSRIGRRAILKPGTILPPGSVVESGAVIDPASNVFVAPFDESQFSQLKTKSADKIGKGMFFVASTGRAGSQTIARVLLSIMRLIAGTNPIFRCILWLAKPQKIDGMKMESLRYFRSYW